jgi:RNA ligase
MAYQHIQNLYRDQTILLFRECFAMEKVHGTSAHIAWIGGQPSFSSGSVKPERFERMFDPLDLPARFESLGHPRVTVFGEAYGASVLKQKWRYGDVLRFVAFDVLIGDMWLTVSDAKDVAATLGLDFVHYVRIPTEMDAIDRERDAPSEQARRIGIVGDKPREGVVLRPPLEVTLNNGSRVMAKHKRDDERETASTRPVADPARLKVLADAQAIADEWVTPTRLSHVMDKLGAVGMDRIRDVITAMTEDILREGAGEFVDSREARSAIGRKTAELSRNLLEAKTHDDS